MNTKLLFRASFCCASNSAIKNFQYISNVHIAAANESIEKFYGRKGKSSEVRASVFLKNPEVANSIASFIAKEWNGGYLLEANAGPGMLTRSFLENGIQPLRIFEKNKEFLPALEVLSADYPHLEIVPQDLMMMPSLEYRKRFESFDQSSYVKEYFSTIFKSIPTNSWESDPSFQIFALIANKRSHKFFRYLLAALPNQGTLFSFGRCDIFLLITETEFMYLNAVPKENLSMYRWSTVLYNLFFEIKCLQKFSTDSENFYFCGSGRSRKRARTPYFYLVKLTPKRDLFMPPMTPEKLQEFFFFVRSNLAKRSDLVIKSIEKWMPFCGPRLIKDGFNVFVKFGDLSPDDIFRLFKNVASWSEYKDCYSEALARQFNRKKFTEDDSGIE